MNDIFTALVQCVSNLYVGRSVNRRAPHKPLLLLLAIADIQNRKPRLRPYSEVEDRLRRALTIFGRPAARQHPQYPFWRLQNDNIWQVESDRPMVARRGSTDPTRKELVAKHARGGFLPEYYEILLDNRELRTDLIHRLLDSHFPSSVHEDIMALFDLDVCVHCERGGISEPTFRRAVLQAYDLRCAVSGLSTTRAGMPVGVEAAYIKWPQSGGGRDVSNGIALSTLHRKLFDLGLFTITPVFRVRVSKHASGPRGFDELLRKFDRQPIRVPIARELQPSTSALEWHSSEVFRG